MKGPLGLVYYNATFYDETVSKYLSVENYKLVDEWEEKKDYMQIYAERYDILGENTADYEVAYQLYDNELLIWQESVCSPLSDRLIWCRLGRLPCTAG